MLSKLKAYIKEKYNKPGNVFLGLVHRLDRPTSGIMVFARTSKAAERLSKDFANRDVFKEYTALVEGFPKQEGEFRDFLIKDEAKNIVSVCEKGKGKLAILNYEVVKRYDGCSRVKIVLKTGPLSPIKGTVFFKRISYSRRCKIRKRGRQSLPLRTKLSFQHQQRRNF